MHGLKLGDQVTMSTASTPYLDATKLVVSEHRHSDQPSLPVDQVERDHWAWLLVKQVKQVATICPGMVLPPLHAVDEKRTFEIKSIDGSSERILYQSSSLLSVAIAAGASDNPSMEEKVGPFQLGTAAIAGLDAQIARLNLQISACSGDTSDYPAFYRRGGVILHGPSGTGKSMLLRMVSEAGWRKVFKVQERVLGERHTAIQDIFTDACKHQPSIIIIDDLNKIASKPKPDYELPSVNLANSLCEGFDRVEGSRVLVLAATQSLASIEESLRRPGRFSREIEIPVPNKDARLEILNLSLGLSKSTRDEEIARLAERSHGYVGADLNQVLEAAVDQANLRKIKLDRDSKKTNDQAENESVGLRRFVADEDIEAALREVQPTAMKGFFFNVPNIKWRDIGGQAEVKEALEEAIQWPLKYAREMEENGYRPEKGLLLYGPPGCSKTLAAKAVATEAGINFIAVKGADFFSQYVGESERALRDIFRKARAASPSIIFFDEIDTIGGARTESPQSGLSVLTTLLNLMDGIEALNGVFILAATNRPDVLDPALLRPGRLESALYVGPPDKQARIEIISIDTRGMNLSQDFDVARLAETADGHSGAEIVRICQQACKLAMKEAFQTRSSVVVTKRHFETALGREPKQITSDMISRFKYWRRR
ncbi:MAG: hypothetical protein Q9220_000963 [cf. Caloplaca sp. 1 TL-2023]